MQKKINCVFVLLFYFPFLSFSQNLLEPDYFEFNFHSGYIVKNHPAFPKINQPAYIAGITVGGKLNGKKLWHKYYHYADFGFNFIFGSLGNKKELGNIAALLPEMTFHHKLSERWKYSGTLGLGISYFNDPFNEVTNPGNIVIGSHIAFCALAATDFEYRIKENLAFTIRPCIYHSSDSHTSLPNVGMNLPLLGIGIKYFPHDEPEIINRDSSFVYDKKIHFNVRLGLGVNEQGGSTGPTHGPKYPIYLTSFFITKNISPVNKLQLGIEGWYNTGVYDYIISQEFFDNHQTMKSTALVLFAGHEFLMGHFSLVTQGGVYLYNPFYKEKIKREIDAALMQKLKTIFPARLGVQYYLFDATVKHRHNLFAGIYIKTNLGQADFLDAGIGYTF